MQSLETKSSRPRPKSFETETRPETFETETSKNGSRDASRDRDQVSRLHHCWAVASYCSELNFQLRWWECCSFFKKIRDAVPSYHHFTTASIRWFSMSDDQKKKFARALPSAHDHSNCSSHCFALILDDLFPVSYSSIRKDLAQVAFDLIDRFHVSSVKTQH